MLICLLFVLAVVGAVGAAVGAGADVVAVEVNWALSRSAACFWLNENNDWIDWRWTGVC